MTKRVETAEIVREYPLPGVDRVAGVTFDGTLVWFAAQGKLRALDPASGEIVRTFDVPADAGTAFDGTHLFQLFQAQILKIDPATGRVVATVPAPGTGCSGLTWAEGSLWVGRYRDRKIHELDPQTGAIRRTIASSRFVTGVTWVDGELWHGTLEDGASDLRRVEPTSGEVLVRLALPEGVTVSGLEAGDGVLYAGGASTGTLRAVRRRAG